MKLLDGTNREFDTLGKTMRMVWEETLKEQGEAESSWIELARTLE